MDNQLLEKAITISAVEAKTAKNGKIFFKIKDQEGKSYMLWQTIKDGSNSKAFEALNPLPNQGLGQLVKITYKEEESDYQGKSITYRTIVMIESPAQALGQVTPSQTPPTPPAEDEKVIGMVRHGIAVQAYAKGKELNQETVNEINKWVDYIITGKIKADEVGEDEVDMSDIPF